MITIFRSRLSSFLHSKALVNLLFIPSTNNFQNVSKALTSVHNARFKHVYKSEIGFETSQGSRYAPPSPQDSAEESVLSLLSNRSCMSDEEWDDFKSDVFDKGSFISEENFSSVVMSILLRSNQLDLSHSFLKYVEKSSVKPNFLTYLKYISLCSRNRRAVNQEYILEMINKVKAYIDANPILDMRCVEYIVQGLCATDKWKESFQYFDKLITGKPSREMCNALACAAIRNNDENIAWEILTKWINAYEPVSDRVIEEFLLVALKIQQTNCRESDKLIEKLFRYMQSRDVVISIDVAKIIEQYFKCHRLKWNVTYTKVNRKGLCGACNNNLNMLNLKNEDFNDLCEGFLKRSVMKSDLYINTNATEFTSYMEFIHRHKPFHVVLDGLNAAHTYQGFQSRKNISFHLLKVIKKLSGQSRNLLVIGRKHMKYWPSIQKISERAKLFFTDNISQDDPFVIYASLASGPHTVFLSGDLMRDHLSRLNDPRLIHLFKRWQLSHQIFLQTDEYNNITFIEPVRHGITVYGNMEIGWHVPFDDKIILEPYEVLNNWICIEKCI